MLLIAYLQATGAESVIARVFVGRETQMIFLAALLGGIAPFCSCEVIPFIAALLMAGTPLSAVMAFWLASPLIDPPSLVITAGALGWPFALSKMALAVGLGLTGGFVIKALSGTGAFSSPLKPGRAPRGCGPAPLSQKPVWAFWQEDNRRDVFRSEAFKNALFLLKWLAFAYVLEAIMITYVPADLIVGLVGGDGVLPIVAGALVGAPAYLNGYAAPALVSGLLEQGMNPGAAMAFLIAGGVSSIPAMVAVYSLVKRKVFVAYLGLGILGAIGAGLVFSVFAPSLGVVGA